MTLELVPWRGSRVPVLTGEIVRYTTQDYINWLTSNQRWYSGAQPLTTIYGSRPAEPISYSFEGFVQGMLYVDTPVAAAEQYRLRVFGQAPLLYQELNEGRPGDFFDNPVLDDLRAPWAGATLSDLMKRALTYGDFAGNAFVLDLDDELVLVRPDWIEIVLAKRMRGGGQVGWKQVGIVYYEGGLRSGDGVPFLPGEYAHFVPGLPDPLATYRGMSWLTPLIREVQADIAAHDHKLAFFENAASPNLAVSLPKEITPQQFEAFVELMDAKHKGAFNAGKTLYTGGGADVTPIGSNMVEMDFARIIGKSETRVANASGVPAVLLSFSEGMQGSSLNAGNYTAAKRNFVDTTMRDLWQNFAGSIQQMDRFKPPRPKSRLWYDGRDIPFLHEDAKDTADITHTQILAVEAGMRAGFKPDPMVQAVRHNNLDLLIGEHTGLFSVQMQPPQSGMEGAPPLDVNGDGQPEPPGTPIDFGALRADLLRGHPYPGQRYRHGWIPVAGSVESMAEMFGDAVTLDGEDNEYIDHETTSHFGTVDLIPGLDAQMYDDGTVLLTSPSAKDADRHHIVQYLHSQETAGELADNLEWAMFHDAGMDLGHRPPDPVTGLDDWRVGSPNVGQDLERVVVGYRHDGTVRVAFPDGNTGNVLAIDLTSEEAREMARGLRIVADEELPEEEG